MKRMPANASRQYSKQFWKKTFSAGTQKWNITQGAPRNKAICYYDWPSRLQ